MGLLDLLSRKPLIRQACPVCGSDHALEGKPVVMAVGGKSLRVGTCFGCVDCGAAYYGLEDGRVSRTMTRERPREVAERAERRVPADRDPGTRNGLEDARLAPREPGV